MSQLVLSLFPGIGLSRRPWRIGHLDVAGDYQPGDDPPEGYLQWHEWARSQFRAGLRQKQCGHCGLWKFPQELSHEIIETTGQLSNGQVITVSDPVCNACCSESQKRRAST